MGTGTRADNRHREVTLPTVGYWDCHWEPGLAPPGTGKWERQRLSLGQDLHPGLGTGVVNWEPRWEAGLGAGVAQAPGLGIFLENGPFRELGNWDGELGLPSHQQHQLGLGTGTSACITWALGPPRHLDQHWILGQKSTGTQHQDRELGKLEHQHQLGPAHQGHRGSVGTSPMGGCKGESSGFGCDGDIPQSGSLGLGTRFPSQDQNYSPFLFCKRETEALGRVFKGWVGAWSSPHIHGGGHAMGW